LSTLQYTVPSQFQTAPGPRGHFFRVAKQHSQASRDRRLSYRVL